jgi:hypothetical protein
MTQSQRAPPPNLLVHGGKGKQRLQSVAGIWGAI